jgi:primosomal protein N' (replication factor Y)
VLVQTLAPEHYALRRAVAHDFAGFYEEELAFRRETGYPPFTFLAGITLSGNNATAVEKGGDATAFELRRLKQELKLRVEILGPVSAPLGKIRGRFRWQILLKAPRRADLHRLLREFRGRLTLPAVVRLVIDIDPVDML